MSSSPSQIHFIHGDIEHYTYTDMLMVAVGHFLHVVDCACIHDSSRSLFSVANLGTVCLSDDVACIIK